LRALIETDQLSPALDSHPQGVQPVDQQALVGVLRVGQGIGEGAQSRSHMPQGYARGRGALDPEVEPRNLDAGLDDRAGKVELSIEFQGARLHGDGARGGSRLSALVDDPHVHPELGQPKRKHEAGRPGPDDQDKLAGH
jgi:hypothetical protein